MFKSFIQKKLENYVRKYFKKHPEIKLVAVAGSVGKTSTKMAIATVLSEKYQVRVHEGNHNTNISAPLSILGIEYPDNIKSIFAWLGVFSAARQRIRSKKDVDVIVQELGTDGIGQIPQFGKYLKPDIGVITAISLEHMEFFKTIEAVASEEFALANFSKKVLINRDNIDGNFAKFINNTNLNTYGLNASAEYHFINQDFSVKKGFVGDLFSPESVDSLKVNVKLIGEHNVNSVVAAYAVGKILLMSDEELSIGISKIRPVKGRMNMLKGVKNSIIIDDTYNSSPVAAEASLRSLYQLNVPQKIAVLGDMNELGDFTKDEHVKLGKMCNPNELSWVVTVGENSREYIAPSAHSNGCQVKSFRNAIEAGAFVRGVVEDGAAILFKGSQGSVYLEEAVKEVLHSQDDETKLVRQSEEWLEKKSQFFESLEK